MRSRPMTDTNDELDSQSENGFGTEHLRRKEQDFLDRIIHGSETGHYFMILGCKVCHYLLSPQRLSFSAFTPRRGLGRRL